MLHEYVCRLTTLPIFSYINRIYLIIVIFGHKNIHLYETEASKHHHLNIICLHKPMVVGLVVC